MYKIVATCGLGGKLQRPLWMCGHSLEKPHRGVSAIFNHLLFEPKSITSRAVSSPPGKNMKRRSSVYERLTWRGGRARLSTAFPAESAVTSGHGGEAGVGFLRRSFGQHGDTNSTSHPLYQLAHQPYGNNNGTLGDAQHSNIWSSQDTDKAFRNQI